MNQTVRTVLMWIVILVGVLLILQVLRGYNTTSREIPFSEFLDRVADGQIERVLIKVEGDMATCDIPNSPIAVKIVRRDGAWRMHMASMYSGRDPKADTRISKRLVAKFRELAGKIGQGGETIDTLRKEYERERQAIQQELLRGG